MKYFLFKADTPPDENILTQKELEKHSSFKIPQRRASYLLGRYALKKAAMKIYPQASFADMEIQNAENGRPVLFVRGEKAKFGYSISHSGSVALAAVRTDGGKNIGVDIEKVESRPASWAEECFSPPERTELDSPEKQTVRWAQKEAVLKFLEVGLKADLWELRFDGSKAVLTGKLEKLAREKNVTEINTEVISCENGFVAAVALDCQEALWKR